ncbi:phage structural protein [Virgibacillus sediminis]|uniref:Phage structural protein n=1 Tax=Virgibacillus sediminis TaxID=202260 RepID=A0ABV7A6P3_9BACI
MPVGTYDSSKVILTVDNTHITGLADGTFISFESAADGFSYVVGANPGDVVVSETNDETRTATVVLQATSPYVKFLDDIAKSKRMVPVYCMNNNEPKEKAGGTMARIQRPASRSYGKEAENREYTIVVFDYTEE